jgi:hypothetical protein
MHSKKFPVHKGIQTEDCNTGKPVTGKTSKLAKIAIKIYRFTEGKFRYYR